MVDRIFDPYGDRPVEVPWRKDYDALPHNHPTAWASRFDLSSWAFFSAHLDGRLVGGAVVAFRTPGVDLLEGRDDLAVLWDLRVAPEVRRTGVGRSLFAAAAAWATNRGASQLKVETQDVNAAACRFYAARGCELAAVDRSAYPDLPGEAQLLWVLALR